MTNHNKPTNAFKKSPQNLDDRKSQGQVERSAGYNIQCHMATYIENSNMVNKAGDVAMEELANGNIKPALEYLKIASSDNKKDALNIIQNNNVQKIYVTKEDEKQANKHIDEIIENG